MPDTEQDEIAELILLIAAKAEGPEVLDAETRAAVEEGMAQARRGEFASDERVAAFFRAR